MRAIHFVAASTLGKVAQGGDDFTTDTSTAGGAWKMRVRGDKGRGARHTSNSRHGAHNQHRNSPADDYILNVTHLAALVGELELNEYAATGHQRA